MLSQIWKVIGPKGDRLMWVIIITLMVLGLLTVYSSASAYAYKKFGGRSELVLFQQMIFLSAGFFLMLVVHSVHYKYYVKFSKPLLYFSYILLFLTMFFGSNTNDAQRWLKIPIIGLSFQPSDFAKVALVLYLARELAFRQDDIKDFKKGFLPIIIHVGITCLLIAPSNLSTSLVILSTSMVIMFIGRVSVKHILYVGGPILAVLAVLVLVLINTPNKSLEGMGRVKTWKNRIVNFSKGSNNPDVTFQNDHAKMAIATGGLVGKGPGGSVERNTLPHAYSDFIYAIFTEEYGLMGAGGLMFLYLFFMYRAFRILLKSPKAFGALLAIGLSFAFVMQALIHMAISANMVPNTGLTLPFISKGGTSILMTSIAFGLIMSVSRYVETETSNDLKTT
jgi:cell division protein FtsW